MLVQFGIAGLTENGMVCSGVSSVSVRNTYKFGHNWIIMCCQGIYCGGSDEPNKNWIAVQCTTNNYHWFHIGCLKKKYKYDDDDIKAITLSEDSVFNCPICK